MADIAAAWPDNGDADALRGGLLYHRYYISRACPFESLDGSVNIADDYDAYLRVEYGNYMSLPPPEKQKPNHGDQYFAPWKYGPTSE